MAQQHFGVSVQSDGTPHITAARKEPRQAQVLAEQVEGTQHFTVQAANKKDAERIARERIGGLADVEAEVDDVGGPDGLNGSEASEVPVPDGRDEFTPTEAELAEAAELKATIESGDGDAAARAAAPAAKAPRPAEKTGAWYGTAQDAEGNSMVTAKPFSNADLARQAAEINLPNKPARIVAVEAASADEALTIYEALLEGAGAEGKLPEQVSKPKPPPGPRVSLVESRKVPVAAEVFLVSATGMLHASPECRFIAGKDSVTLHGRPDAVADVMRGETFLADDNRRKVTLYCVYCAATTESSIVATQVPAAAAEQVAEAIEAAETGEGEVTVEVVEEAAEPALAGAEA